MPITRYPDYGERREEKPVRLDRTEGTVIIEGKAYPAREIVEALAQSGYSEIRSTGDALILGRRKITPIYKSSQERAMAALCHSSLSYCCPMTKRCAERDRALEILGLSIEEYEQLKGDAHHRFLDASRSGSSAAYDWGDVPQARAANKPAIDRGFGTDDYRRDFDALDRSFENRSKPLSATDRRDRWDRENSARGYERSSSDYTSRGRSGSFTDVPMDGSLMDEMRHATRELDSKGVCRIGTDPNLEGIGALFSEGELSPFTEEAKRESGRLSFCFSCGRTFEPNTKVCPYCGAPQ
ncbi:MAG: hypothetical protein ACFFEF_00655 [Candidatus Thorarchaeota archaeon]